MEARIDTRPGQVAIVIGIDHKIQHVVPGIAASHPRNALRLRFQELLEQITGGYRVDVICEEAKHGVVSIAQALADRECIPYRNIEMPPELTLEDRAVTELFGVAYESIDIGFRVAKVVAKAILDLTDAAAGCGVGQPDYRFVGSMLFTETLVSLRSSSRSIRPSVNAEALEMMGYAHHLVL
jgi:hypothetical protein